MRKWLSSIVNRQAENEFLGAVVLLLLLLLLLLLVDLPVASSCSSGGFVGWRNGEANCSPRTSSIELILHTLITSDKIEKASIKRRLIQVERRRLASCRGDIIVGSFF